MRYALVTGASGGIGRAICLKLSEDHNFHILVNYYKNAEAAEETVRLIRGAGGSAESIAFDVSDKSAVDAAIKQWEVANNDAVIEILINNAGLIKDRMFMMMEEESWDSILDVKLKGFFNVTRCIIQKMLLNRFGRIVNISSIVGVTGNPGQVNYAAANGGLIAATKALAKEVGKRNITVNAVAPGYIHTEMTTHLNTPELVKYIPLNRFGEAEEVADLVSFLVSEKAAYIHGEVIHINGGIA